MREKGQRMERGEEDSSRKKADRERGSAAEFNAGRKSGEERERDATAIECKARRNRGGEREMLPL